LYGIGIELLYMMIFLFVDTLLYFILLKTSAFPKKETRSDAGKKKLKAKKERSQELKQ